MEACRGVPDFPVHRFCARAAQIVRVTLLPWRYKGHSRYFFCRHTFASERNLASWVQWASLGAFLVPPGILLESFLGPLCVLPKCPGCLLDVPRLISEAQFPQQGLDSDEGFHRMVRTTRFPRQVSTAWASLQGFYCKVPTTMS